MHASLSREIIAAIERAIESSGHAAVLASPENEQPFRFNVMGKEFGVIVIWVYARALTPAARANRDEYRIQIKRADLPMALNQIGPTLLLGYYSPEDFFVGFDPTTVPIGAKTQLSVGYVSLRVMKRSKREGMTFDRDRRGRIAVGVRGDMLVAYALNAVDIHHVADDDELLQLLQTAAGAFKDHSRSADDLEQRITKLSDRRKRLLRRVRLFSRDGGFRDRVLSAYESRCAVSGMQLGLVDAAHILPVCAPGSTDMVNNGVPLLPNYHRAFDTGLIFLTDDYVMKINEPRARSLNDEGLSRGLQEFRQTLGKIRLPTERHHWPDPNMIKQANAVRKIEVG